MSVASPTFNLPPMQMFPNKPRRRFNSFAQVYNALFYDQWSQSRPFLRNKPYKEVYKLYLCTAERRLIKQKFDESNNAYQAEMKAYKEKFPKEAAKYETYLSLYRIKSKKTKLDDVDDSFTQQQLPEEIAAEEDEECANDNDDHDDADHEVTNEDVHVVPIEPQPSMQREDGEAANKNLHSATNVDEPTVEYICDSCDRQGRKEGCSHKMDALPHWNAATLQTAVNATRAQGEVQKKKIPRAEYEKVLERTRVLVKRLKLHDDDKFLILNSLEM